MPSSRRVFLTGAGIALTGLAGCSGTPTDSSSPTSIPTSTPTPTTPARTDAALGDAVTLGDGTTVTVSDVVDAHSVRYLTAPDAFGVADAGGDQFVFVRLTVEGGGTPPDPDVFALVADGTAYEPGVEGVGPARVDAPVSGRPYDGTDRPGYLGVRVPAPLDADDVAITLADAARWTFPSSAAAQLRSPAPEFETSLTVPESVAAAEAIPVRIDVTNEGDGGGVFRGAVNHQGPRYAADPFSFSLPPAESTTHEVTVGYDRGSDSPPASVAFDVVGPGVSESFAVRIAGE